MANTIELMDISNGYYGSSCSSTLFSAFPFLSASSCFDSSLLKLLSVLSGYLSVFLWILVLLPQIYTTYKTKKTDSVSKRFLGLWFIGDLLNLIGSILTNQLPFQIFLPFYFVLVDVIMFIQCFHYKEKKFNTGKSSSTITLTRKNSSKKFVKFLLFWLLLGSGVLTLIITSISDSSLKELKGKKAGLAVSWLCAGIYIFSRVPQFLKNYKRKSVEGLSKAMFVFAFLGNLTYVISIISHSTEKKFILNSMPFLISSAGTILFDVAMLVQFYIYENSQSKAYHPVVGNNSYCANGAHQRTVKNYSTIYISDEYYIIS